MVEFMDGGAYGDFTCGQVGCASRAVWHLRLPALYLDGSVDTALTCAEHLDEIPTTDYEHAHPFGAACNMPGTVWSAADDDLSRCLWPVDHETHELDTADR